MVYAVVKKLIEVITKLSLIFMLTTHCKSEENLLE